MYVAFTAAAKAAAVAAVASARIYRKWALQIHGDMSLFEQL